MTSGSAKDGVVRVWHPIEDIRSLAETMCRAMDGAPLKARRRGGSAGYRAGDHNLALTESPNGFTVTVELPEVRKKDLHLNVAETSVTIFARWTNERKIKERGGAERVELAERIYSRVVQLPAPVKTDQARATFKDRVLRIVLRRAKPSQVRRIEVK